MAFWDNYKREESDRSPKTGEMRCVILSAEKKVSSKGKNMIEVVVQPSGSRAKVKTWLVEGDRFNKNATELFDSFSEIGEGNFNLVEWTGAVGAANFGLDSNGYLTVKWFISAKKAEKLPEFVGEKPEKVDVVTLEDIEDDDGDLPF